MVDNQLSMKGMLLNLNHWVEQVRSSWAKARCIQDRDLFGSNYSIEVSDGMISVLPCFNSYCHCWTLSGISNPLLFDWLLFKLNDDLHIRYLFTVTQVLEEQVDLWSVDDISTYSIVFLNFKCFIESLKRFIRWISREFNSKLIC